MKKQKICIILDESIINHHHGVRRYLISFAEAIKGDFDIDFICMCISGGGKSYYKRVFFNEAFIINNGFDNDVLVGKDRHSIIKSISSLGGDLLSNSRSFCSYTYLGEIPNIYDICILGAPWVCDKYISKYRVRTYCVGYDAIPNIYSLGSPEDLGLKKFAAEHLNGYIKAVDYFDGVLAISEQSKNEISSIINSNKISVIPAFIPSGFNSNFQKDVFFRDGNTAILAAPFDKRKGLDSMPDLINKSNIEKLIIFGGIRCSLEDVYVFFDKLEINDVEWWSRVTTGKQIELYSTSDLLLFPSLSEGLGLPVIEAISCGTNVIVTDIPPLNNLVPASSIIKNSMPKEEVSNLINSKLNNINSLENVQYAISHWDIKIVSEAMVRVFESD